MSASQFSAELWGRIVGLVGSGATLSEASSEVGIKYETVKRWIRCGRNGDEKYVPFVVAYEQARDNFEEPGPPTEDELLERLNKASKNGSVTATKLLLEMPWERKSPNGKQATDQPATGTSDPFAELDAAEDELARKRAQKAG